MIAPSRRGVTRALVVSVLALLAWGCSRSNAPTTTPLVAPRTAPTSEDPSIRAKKWRFATFFNRFKRLVRERWHPARVLAGSPDVAARAKVERGTHFLETMLDIGLDADGMVVICKVRESSGVAVFDNHTVAAVFAAQPFHHVPPDLVDRSEGRVKFKFRFRFDLPPPAAVADAGAPSPDAGRDQ